MNICVFLSAADLDERYTRPAREFALQDHAFDFGLADADQGLRAPPLDGVLRGVGGSGGRVQSGQGRSGHGR